MASASSSTFKQRTTYDYRCKESERMKRSYPTKIPVVLERSLKEKDLPNLDTIKYLIPSCFVTGQLIQTLRLRLELKESQSLFLLANGTKIVGCTTLMEELYNNEADEDGFLYVTYASHEVFGF